MFTINASLLLLSIVYSLMNLKVKTSVLTRVATFPLLLFRRKSGNSVYDDDKRFSSYLILVADNAKAETFNGNSML